MGQTLWGRTVVARIVNVRYVAVVVLAAFALKVAHRVRIVPGVSVEV
jgi:hypothetical protein